MTDWNGQLLTVMGVYPYVYNPYETYNIIADGTNYQEPDGRYMIVASMYSVNVERITITFEQNSTWTISNFNGFTLAGPLADASIARANVVSSAIGPVTLRA
jgi:hypothetical protein